MKIVTIGGGTGTYNLLQGLKKHNVELTAIVSMMDDGGSSGVLRDEYGILPPGDLRQAIVALSEESMATRKLFEYRFEAGQTLSGHSLGNLMITALINIYGSELEAIKHASKILNIKGKVLPVTTDKSKLRAELEDGSIIYGETNINTPKHDSKLKIKRIWLEPVARLHNECYDAIKDANIIVICPGGFHYSILPNFQVSGLKEAVSTSNAKVIFIPNIMTIHGETSNYTTRDFVNILEKYIGKNVIDYVITNTKQPLQVNLSRYAAQNSFLVEDTIDESFAKQKGFIWIRDNIIKEPILVRHDADKVAEIIIDISNKIRKS